MCALTACNKTGPFGFKEGQIYTDVEAIYEMIDYQSEQVGTRLVSYKVIEAGRDYIVFTKEGAEEGGDWYKKRVVGESLGRYARRWKLKE